MKMAQIFPSNQNMSDFLMGSRKRKAEFETPEKALKTRCQGIFQVFVEFRKLFIEISPCTDPPNDHSIKSFLALGTFILALKRDWIRRSERNNDFFRFNRKYESLKHEADRFTIFRDEYQKIRELLKEQENAISKTDFGLNGLSDMAEEEFKKVSRAYL